MSVKAMSAAFEIGDELNLSAIDRLILLRLGDWADDFGYCWPGIDDLQAKVGVDARTVQRHLAWLDRAGLLVRVIVGGGRHRSTLYRMLPLVLPDSAQAPGRTRYIARFGNGDTVPPFTAVDGGAARPETVTGDAKKPRHSSVTRSIMIHHDPSDISNVKNPDLPPPTSRGVSMGQDAPDQKRLDRQMKSIEEVRADAIEWNRLQRIETQKKRRDKRINYTVRAAEDIASGVHPVTGRPLLGSETCGTCGLAVKAGHGARGYWKCNSEGGRFVTRSEASDIRLKWPACRSWLPLAELLKT